MTTNAYESLSPNQAELVKLTSRDVKVYPTPDGVILLATNERLNIEQVAGSLIPITRVSFKDGGYSAKEYISNTLTPETQELVKSFYKNILSLGVHLND